MLRYGNSKLAWILSGLLTLTALGCGSSASDDPAVTASIDSGSSGTETTADTPQTVEVSTGSVYDDSSSTPSPAAPRKRAVQLHPVVLIKTNQGDIKIELDAENSPMTVENFIAYVEDGFYNQTVFHYVEQGYMISAGGFTADGESKETRAYVLNEAHNGQKNLRGTIAMARDPQYKHSAAEQFYINLVDNESLDHVSDESDESYGYCVFGKVTQGMDIVDAIAAVEVTNDELFVKRPVEPVVIESVERLK